MSEKLPSINNFNTMEKQKKLVISPEFAKKYLPHLNLADPLQTLAKLNQVIKVLKAQGKTYESLDEDSDREELDEAYDVYIQALAEILPEGYVLEPVSMPKLSKFWRGTDPFIILSLLSDNKNQLKLESEHPNVAHKWETSLSYGQIKDKNNVLPFVLALGFKEPVDFIRTIPRGESSDLYKDVIEVASGTVDFNDVREIAIRFNGKKPGNVFPPKFYRVVLRQKSIAA